MAEEVIELYEQVLRKERSNKDSNCVVRALKTVRDAYRALSHKEESDLISYNHAENRYAYIYYYAVCHTSVVIRHAVRIFLKNPVVFDRLMGYDNEELEICSLGGGPGCDLIGLLHIRSLAGLGATNKINCTVVDICSGWQYSLQNILRAYLDTSGGSIYKEKLRFELIRSDLLAFPPRLSALRRVATTDVLTLVKFVSAVPAEQILAILMLIFSLLKRGAYVFFLDSAGGNAYETTAYAAIKAGLVNVCPLMEIQDVITKKKLSSIGPLKMSSRPLKATFICSSVWQKL